jgi:hypothetical protein
MWPPDPLLPAAGEPTGPSADAPDVDSGRRQRPAPGRWYPWYLVLQSTFSGLNAALLPGGAAWTGLRWLITVVGLILAVHYFRKRAGKRNLAHD